MIITDCQDQEDVIEETGSTGGVNPKAVKRVSEKKKIRAGHLLNSMNRDSWQRGVIGCLEYKGLLTPFSLLFRVG